MEDAIKYMADYIPAFIVVDNNDWTFQLFINHSYDIRIMYVAPDGDGFKYLVENIQNSKDLLEALQYVRECIIKDGHIDADYNNVEHNKEMNS